MTEHHQGPPDGLTVGRIPAEPGLDCYVDVVASGSVRGADARCTPDDVTALLGTDFFEHPQKDLLYRSYGPNGLIDFWWQRWEPDGDWVGHYFSLKPRRLEVPLLLADLRQAAQAAGCPLGEPVPDDSGGYVRCHRRESSIEVIADDDEGEVFSITANDFLPPPSPWSRQAVQDSLRHLLGIPDKDRRRWVERRMPEPPELADWWGSLRRECSHQLDLAAPGERDAWVRLRLWLELHAAVSGAFDRADSAMNLAYVVDQLKAPEPTADEVVRGCLDALPVARADVPTRDNTALARQNLDAMRISRGAKDLVDAALLCRDRVQDPELRAELAAWVQLLDRLF